MGLTRILFLVCFAAEGGVSQSLQKVIEFSVRRYPRVDITSDDVRTILSRAADTLNATCNRLNRSRSTKNNKPDQQTELVFSLRDDLSSIATLSDSVLDRADYPDSAKQAVRESERTGMYGRDAVEGLMITPNPAGVLQINIVEKIVSPCPSEFTPIPTPQRETAPEGEYPWLGCSGYSGNVTVLRLFAPRVKSGSRRRYQRWASREGILWAHEISHLLGLEDLEPALRPRLPRLQEGFGWLMMHPFDPMSVWLFPEECEVVMNYPANENQRDVLRKYIEKVSTPDAPKLNK